MRRLAVLLVPVLAGSGLTVLLTAGAAEAASACAGRHVFQLTASVHTELPVVSATNLSTNCTMGVGNAGEGVLALQLALNSSCHSAGLVVDRQYGTATASAVKDAQRAGGLTGSQVDGVYGPTTRTHITWPTYNSTGRFTGCSKVS